MTAPHVKPANSKFTTCCTTDFRKRCLLICCLLALAVVVGLPQAAFAGNCLQDEFSLSAPQKLGCTAGDVKVAKVINVRDP